MGGHEGEQVEVLISRFQPGDIVQQLPVQFLDLFFGSDTLIDLQLQVLIDSNQLLLLGDETMVLPVEIDEYSNFGLEQVRIDRLIDIVHGSGLVASENIFLPVVIGRDKNDGDMP